jgi:hypothetical protein
LWDRGLLVGINRCLISGFSVPVVALSITLCGIVLRCVVIATIIVLIAVRSIGTIALSIVSLSVVLSRFGFRLLRWRLPLLWLLLLRDCLSCH